MYEYVKALHIIFIVTWFSGMFYIVRLFIYNTEASQKSEPEKSILNKQFTIMIRRLWFGITWPSAILTLIFGGWMLYLFGSVPAWLAIKIAFVAGLYLYHLSLHNIFMQQMKSVFKYSSTQLRLWNEVATIFLIAIVMLVEVKQA
ncbi:MAG: protoporphyrinogen IX oxidase, partial [Chitinophagaceae bacterium]